MDVFFTAPDAAGSTLAVIYTFFNSGSFVDYSFLLFAPTAAQTIANLESAAISSMTSYASGHSYTVSNTQKWYPALAAVALSGSYTDLTNKPTIPGAPTQSSATRSIVTGTGATGFQVSATQPSFVNYNVTIATTATIGGNASGTVVLEIAPTNSSTAGDWVEIGRFTNGQAITLALVLQSVQTLAGQLSGMVPAGYYAKLRSINNAGTPTYTYNSGQEMLL